MPAHDFNEVILLKRERMTSLFLKWLPLGSRVLLFFGIAFGTVLFSLTPFRVIGAIIFVVCSVFQAVSEYRRTQVFENLLEENKNSKAIKQKLEELIQFSIKELGESTNTWDAESRITIYRYHAGRLYPVIRRSANPDLANCHRTSYPVDCGFIKNVFENYEYLAQNLSKEDSTESLKPCMPQEDIDNFSFHPGSCAGIRIDTHTGEPIAIIFIEHKQQNKITPSTTRKIKSSSIAHLIKVGLLEYLKNY